MIIIAEIQNNNCWYIGSKMIKKIPTKIVKISKMTTKMAISTTPATKTELPLITSIMTMVFVSKMIDHPL
jgi:hypothetical protein